MLCFRKTFFSFSYEMAVNYYFLQAPSFWHVFMTFFLLKVYTAQKDKSALEQYMKEIPAGSPEYLKAESALKVSNE